VGPSAGLDAVPVRNITGFLCCPFYHLVTLTTELSLLSQATIS